MKRYTEEDFKELVAAGNTDKVAKLLFNLYEQGCDADEIIMMQSKRIQELENERRVMWEALERQERGEPL